MSIVYICEPNCSLHKCIDFLIVKKAGHKIDSIPLVNVNTIVVVGNTQISTQVFGLLFAMGIDVVFMSMSGRVKGRVNAEKSSNIILRIAQYKKWNDNEFTLMFAKIITTAKIKNQLWMLKKYYEYKKDEELRNAIVYIESTSQNLSKQDNLNSLMGTEGICAKKYFSVFSKCLKNMEFKQRVRRPAYDPVNALLNLGYAFLANEISTRLSLYSFDLELGFYHGIKYGRKSLALDLMEEFRACFIDSFVVSLFNKRQFKKDNFEITDEGCILKSDSIKKFCALYNEYVSISDDNNQSWMKIFDRQILNFRKTLLEGKAYKPYAK
jgi:CRISP-associated protein Cas1